MNKNLIVVLNIKDKKYFVLRKFVCAILLS